ncbi:cytochrome b-c1 complex subunit 9 [Pseudonaja textilis]|uniref:Complex III subunit 9 n=1 Tax=Pseudonaja textilis TaxID=8673 RepID=A0A670ZWP0_PSETE|nr:cytochrome b-c1 complex subunit 9 [Pseudonaja textilis]
MAFAQQLYNAVFRRTSTLVLTVVVGAVIFERGFNQATEAIFCRLNEGRLWKDIKHKYEVKQD